MSGWPIVKLATLISVVMGQAPPGATCNKESEGTPFVKAGEFRSRFPIVREWTTRPLRMARRGDALVCVVGATAGKVNQGIDCAIGRSVAALRPDVDSLDPDYLYRYLSSKAEYLRAGSQGMAQGVITREMLGVLEIPLPPIEEQRRIAAILDRADVLRVKRREALARLDELTQSIFIDMFGDPVVNERKWPAGVIGDFVDRFEGGKNIVGSGDSADGYRVLKVSAVTSLSYRESESKPLPEGYVPPTSHMVQVGDLLFSRANTSELVGATALVADTDGRTALPDKLWRFKWKDESAAVPGYVAALFQRPSFRRKVSDRATGSSGSMKNISQGKVLSIPVGIPPVELQADFESLRVGVDSMKRDHRAALSELDALFSSLQSRAFRGEL